MVGCGRIFGGGIAPSIAGYVAQHYGIQNILYLALLGVILGIIVCLFLKETAPRKARSSAQLPLQLNRMLSVKATIQFDQRLSGKSVASVNRRRHAHKT